MVASLSLGAPGLYTAPDARRRTLAGLRMDVAAFVGVAPRGPCREPVPPENREGLAAIAAALGNRRRSVPVPVESWEQYRTAFGAYEGPGRLPYAVASFFENGGERCWVVRIVHDYGGPADGEGVARLVLGGVASSGAAPELAARSEGAWGNRLRAALGHRLRPVEVGAGFGPGGTLVLPGPQAIERGSLLRVVRANPTDPAHDYDVLRFVRDLRRTGAPGTATVRWEATLSVPPLPAPPTRAELLEGTLEIVDEGSGRTERFDRLGFSSAHSRWIATVVFGESALALPTADWLGAELTPLALAPGPGVPGRFEGGTDRYDDIVHADFLDAEWTAGQEDPASGVHALAGLADLSLVCVPDLYVPEPLAPRPEIEDPGPLSNADFGPCVTPSPALGSLGEPAPALPGLLLDPGNAADLATITGLQRALVALADRLREFVVLLDVPPGLSERQILAWRAEIASPWAAAYHPWLRTDTAEDAREALTLLNPSAAAAGIVARQERLFGVPHGPANVLARAVVAADAVVAPTFHNQVHPLGINVFARERDGVRLTAARTLSPDPRLRQLSVLRLMVMLRRVLTRQMQWVVFEPNGPPLRADLRRQLRTFLRGLYRAGAFRGATEEEAFFVRCDASLNPPQGLDRGRLVAEIGVAPSEPLEFIVLRIAREADGTLSVEA